MDLDIEHTLPPPVPSAEYLAAVRLSIEEFARPKLGRKSHKSGQKINNDLESTYKSDIGNLSKEEFSTGFQKGKYVRDPNAPHDRGYFVLITVGLFGLAHMLPFLFFFTANEYWMFKFRNTTSDSQDANDRTYMQRYFSSLTTLTVTTPGVVCNFIAAIGGHKIKATTRVFFVLFVHSSILILQAVFVTIDTDSWQEGFLIISLISQLVMSCAMSLGGSGSMGLISKLPPHYMKAHLMGEGGSGLFSATLRLVSILVTPSTTGAAFMYFATGSSLMIVTTIVFYFATRTKFFRYYTRSAKEDVKEDLRKYRDIIDVLKVLWPMVLLPLFGMLVPVASITSLVVSEYNGTDNVWGNKYFVTICTFLIPAIAGLIGRGIFNGFDIDFSIPTLYVITISREIIFGVLLFLSNAKPRHNLPVIVNHDWQYALVAAGQALTSGFLMNLNMIKSMRMVPPNRVELSMMITMFFLSIFMAATSPLGVLAVSLL